MSHSGQLHVAAEPLGEPRLFHVMRSHCQHCVLGFVDVGRVWGPDHAVQVEEENERCPCSALVPFWEWFHAR